MHQLRSPPTCQHVCDDAQFTRLIGHRAAAVTHVNNGFILSSMLSRAADGQNNLLVSSGFVSVRDQIRVNTYF